jgi:hypothetical protein
MRSSLVTASLPFNSILPNRLGFVRKPFCLLILCAVSAASQTVEGDVVSSRSGAGIAGVKVAIVQMEKTVYSTTTDSQGHFLIQQVKDGAYSATFSASEYWPEYWNGTSAPPRFEVSAGNPVQLEARMAPLPRLRGRVLDGRGKPVPYAQLELLGTVMVVMPLLRTDAKGKFDFPFPFPGSYTLAAVPPAKLKELDLEPDSNRVLGWTRTFYPGVASYDAASKIAALPGVEPGDVELKLLAVPAHVVRGVILDPNGNPFPKVTVSLRDMMPIAMLLTQSKPDGTFEFPPVVDGHWRLSAEVESHGAKLRSEQWMEMAGHDVEGVKLQVNPPFGVSGKVVMEVPEGAPKPALSSLRVSITRSDGRGTFRADVRTSEEGTFTLEHVYPGTYQIEAEGPPEYYLSEVQAGEARSTVQELALSSDAVPITLTYRTNGGTVRGTAEKCGWGEVLLLPRDVGWQHTREKIYRTRCDSNDRYEIASVRPGQYYALALTGSGPKGLPTPGELMLMQLRVGSPSPYAVPFDNSLLNQASAVAVRAGETSSVELRAITRQLY